jgi:hypothetical protein
MKVRFNMLAMLAAIASIALLAGVLVAPAADAQQPAASTNALTTTLTGTAADATGTVVGTVSSVLSITGFANQNGQLVANGTLTSTITNALTGAVQTVTQSTTVPLTASGSCQILHLTLGPLDLNLLGLQVHLNQVVLDVTAQSGPGNLLGNLLCAVAHLLDNPAAPAGGLAGLLNNLLANL